MMRTVHTRLGLVTGGLCASLLGACLKTPTPDPDGAPGLAYELRLNSERRDTLECQANDCADWFRVYVSGPGTLRVAAATTDLGADSSLTLFLGDDRADLIDRTTLTREGRLIREVDQGYYFVQLTTVAERSVRYVLLASFEPKPVATPRPRAAQRPRPARPTVLSGQVVEVEGQAGRVDGVLFRVERPERLRTGLRGRLLQGKDVIGEVEVTEIYSGGGARARVLGPLRARIDATTQVAIDVPAATR